MAGLINRLSRRRLAVRLSSPGVSAHEAKGSLVSQPKVLPTGVRVLIGIVLGLLGFAFPLLFIPAGLILWSVFEDQKAPSTNHPEPVTGRQSAQFKSTSRAPRTNADTATLAVGQRENPTARKPIDPQAEASDKSRRAIEPTPVNRTAVCNSSLESVGITPAEFLHKFGITCFYHFTDTRNLASIQAHGGLLPWSHVKGKVPAPGGNDWSHDADAIKGQDQFVHLCFLPEHPMEFVAKRDGRIRESRFLRIDPNIIHTPGVLFCPDVGNKAGVPMLGLTDAISQMDFEIIAPAHNRWLGPPLFERKKAACRYELLVPCKVPLSLISGI